MKTGTLGNGPVAAACPFQQPPVTTAPTRAGGYRSLGLLAAACLLTLGSLPAAWAKPDRALLPDDLTQLSLEELMSIEVTSVSKKPQKRSEAAAAVFVITADDIRRWGVTSIPDALRMVPGLHVARIDANKWAVTSRGFNSRFANKLLVLMDGRSVYTPLFAGVYWEAQDTPLEDIERIEVIRGPGGALWGANAVNGVINIITRDAASTQGNHLTLGAGNEERGFATLRHGGRLHNGAAYRVYARAQRHDDGFTPGGAHDHWQLGQTGFRSDWEPTGGRHFTIQGDAYNGRLKQQITTAVDPAPATTTFVDEVEIRGANLLLRWQQALRNGADFTLQAYLDNVQRDGAVLYEDRQTLDIDFQHHLAPAGRHDVLWGVAYRRTEDDTRANASFSLDPAQRGVDLFSAFLQDEITLIEDRLVLTIGTKLEHNDFTGAEFQPNLRIAWTPDSRQTLWAALSRAVRTPSRGEHDVSLRLLGTGTDPVLLLGDEGFESEQLLAYEMGYRLQASEEFSLDIATFFNDYRKLRTFDATIAPPPVVGLPFDNRLQGQAYGIEVAAQWQLRPGWRLQGAYSFQSLDLDLVSGSTDTLSQAAEDANPRHQASLWSALDLSHRWELGTGLRYVGRLQTPAGNIDRYVALDARLGWKPVRDLELSLVGRGLLENHHREFHPDFIQTQGTEVERSIYAKLGWTF